MDVGSAVFRHRRRPPNQHSVAFSSSHSAGLALGKKRAVSWTLWSIVPTRLSCVQWCARPRTTISCAIKPTNCSLRQRLAGLCLVKLTSVSVLCELNGPLSREKPRRLRPDHHHSTGLLLLTVSVPGNLQAIFQGNTEFGTTNVVSPNVWIRWEQGPRRAGLPCPTVLCSRRAC